MYRYMHRYKLSFRSTLVCIYTLGSPTGLSMFHNFRKSSGIKFHTSSVLRNSASPKKVAQAIPTEWILYEEMSRYERSAYIRCCTAISPITVALFTGPIKLPPESVRDGARQHGNNWFTEFNMYWHTNLNLHVKGKFFEVHDCTLM